MTLSNWIFEWFLFDNVRDIRSDLKHAKDTAHDLATLERRFDRLALSQAAIWQLVKDRLQLTDEDLRLAIHAADMSQTQASIQTCPTCGRPVGPRANHCVFCGVQPTKTSP